MIYPYKCKACLYQWDVIQSITDEPVKLCPQCKTNHAERLIVGGENIIFKGKTGWDKNRRQLKDWTTKGFELMREQKNEVAKVKDKADKFIEQSK